jgi:hypothetical protein
MRRLLIAILLLMLALLLPATPAGATKSWCRSDPLVLIDGEFADIFVSGPPEAPLVVTGPTQIVVRVPRGVAASLVVADLGFGRGTEVSFAESRALRVTEHGIEVRIDVYVPAEDDTMPIRVEFAPRIIGILWPSQVEGAANEWVTLDVTF